MKKNDEMRAEYDFSEGIRGKFYRPEVKLNLPIYLDDEALAFVTAIAEKKNTDISTIVNELIHSDIRLAEMIR